jgi:hypothetical protein
MLALLRRQPKARPPSMPISHVRIIGRDAKPFDQDAQLIGWYRDNFPFQTARIEAETYGSRAAYEASEREQMRDMTLAEAVAILARKPERGERRDGR